VAEAKEKKSETMNGQNNQKNTKVTPNIPENKTNIESIETTKRIQKGMEITPDDSNNEIDAEIYNSKNSYSSEHKKATDYIKN